MSRNKKQKPSPAAPRVVPGGIDSAALAEAALGASRFKDAIEHFKGLLKRERRPAWLQGLATAYAGRAEQLAAKDMIREALALWRTRSEACGVPLLGAPYVAWLLKDGQLEQALGLLAAAERLPPAAQAEAYNQLAAAVLVAPEALLSGLSSDSPMLRQRAAARAALAACVRGDEAALAEALQAISFHSPYRDLRPLLKALVLQASDPQAAAAALARVPDKGPFEALAQALRVSLMPGREWLAALRQLDAAGRALVLDLKGCPPSQRALVLDLMSRLESSAPATELFELVLRQHRVIGEGAARQLCLRLLPHVPQRLDAFRASFVPLTAAEQARVLALAAELKRQPGQAETHWLRLVQLLRATPDTKPRAALVLRRLADQHAHHRPDGELCTHAQNWLGQSLELDPADRATHLRLIRDARKSGDLKQARARLEAAHKLFPDDAPLLLEAVEIALAAGAFKKAAGLAKHVLALDPIDPRVRTTVVQAHLAHARKQLVAKNLPAARRELDEAENWLRSGSERGLLKLLQGLAAASADAGDALLREALVELGGPCVGVFHLLLEGERAKLVPEDLLRRAGADLSTTPSAAEVLALAHALDKLPERDPALHAALNPLRDRLERAAGMLHLSEGEHLQVCEALHRHRESELTRQFAVAALARWPKRLVFVYLEAAARFGAQPWLMPEREWKRLDDLLDQARDAGDHRTAARLGQLLDASDGGPFDEDMSDDDGDEDEEADFGPDDLRAMLDMMLNVGGEDSLIEMARKQLGKAAVEQMRREVGGSKKKLAEALLKMLMMPTELGPRPPKPVVVGPRKPPARTPMPRAQNQPNLFED